MSTPDDDKFSSDSALPREKLIEFFSPRGLLDKSLEHYEFRQSQVDFSLAVAQAIDTGDTLLAEAGTGIGKTLGYLVPALMSGLKIVISTGTKTLQDQLLNKDLPILQNALDHDFDVALLKGRSNYLCEARFINFAAQGILPGHPDADLFDTVLQWRRYTQSGDRAEINTLPDGHPLWSQLSVNADQCKGGLCSEYETCWSNRMRRRAMECQVLIVNHHLYFADMALRQSVPELEVAVLPPHDLVIFDEAHEIDEIAADYFGYTFSEKRVRQLCQDLRELEDSASPLQARILHNCQAIEGISTNLFDTIDMPKKRQAFIPTKMKESTGALVDRLDESLALLETQVSESTSEDMPRFIQRTNDLRRDISFLVGRSQPYGLHSQITFPTEEATEDSEFSQVPPSKQAFVRFMETSGRNRRLTARPLHTAPVMKTLYSRTQVILVSATLSIGKSFEHFKERLGIDSCMDVCIASPFDYANESLLYLGSDLPSPKDMAFAPAANRRIEELLDASKGGALVLCASHKRLMEVGHHLKGRLDLDIFQQGDASRHHLLNQFQRHRDSVLVATLSFWRGIDIPGPSLRLVVIDKLPFASPEDPVVAGHMAYLRKLNRNAFMEYSVPQATLLLKQGFGRLIRNRQDRGVVAILDQRIINTSFGKKMSRSLPNSPRTQSAEQTCDFLSEHYERINRPRR
jgi:ATP-dependent DNA helicase DinG